MKSQLSAVVMALLLAGTTALAGEQRAGASPMRSEPARKLEIPDEQLVDQDGRPVRLYSELMKGRAVAVNFVFTTCTTICSPMTAVFRHLTSVIIGDSVTGTWLKALAMAPPENLSYAVEHLNDADSSAP